MRIRNTSTSKIAINSNNIGFYNFRDTAKTIVRSFYGILSFCITAKSSTRYSKKGILLNQFNEIKIWYQPQSFIKTFSTLFDGNWLSEYIYGSSDSLCIKTFYRHEFFPNVKTTLINASKQIPLPTRDHVCAHKKWFLINLVEAFSILQNADLEFCIQWMNLLLLIRKLNFWMNEQCLR